MKYKDFFEISKNLAMLSQLGLMLLTPLVMCIVICWLLNRYLGVGAWVYIIGFFFGLGGSFMSAYKLYLNEKNKNSRDNRTRAAFNSHR